MTNEDRQTGERRREATAAFHERMARAFESVGKTKDAASAREAARLARAADPKKFVAHPGNN